MSRRQNKKRPSFDDQSAKKAGGQNLYLAWAICGMLIFIVMIVFGQTLRHGFVNYDDDQYVFNNPQVARGLTIQGIFWAFTTNHATNWHPLTWLSHMLDCQVYGLAPGGHHLTNVMLHAVSAILLFLILHGMTGDLWPSAFAATIFAIHPLRVESVAWVAERKDILSGLFFMLTLWAYISYTRHRFSLIRYMMVIGVYLLGLMSKPMLVTLPFVLLLLDYWPLKRMTPSAGPNQSSSVNLPWGQLSIPMRLVFEKVPLLALAAATCAITLWAQSKALTVSEHVSLPLRIGNALVAYIDYIGKLFYPACLAVMYPYPLHGLPGWEITGSFFLLTVISISVVACRKRYPFLLVGWFWYLGMLVPVIGLVQVGLQAAADRYTYLPQIGLIIAITWALPHVIRQWPYGNLTFGIGSLLVVAALIDCAYRQTTHWHDSEALWTHALSCTSQNYVAHNNLGTVMAQTNRVPGAIEHYKQALLIKPNYTEALYNQANAYKTLGQYQQAIGLYEKVLQLKPDYIEAYNNLGISLVQIGKTQEAIQYYNKAIRLNPAYPETHYNLGIALAGTGDPERAIEHYRQAIELMPDYVKARNNLGNALFKTDRFQEAIEQYKQAIHFDPNFIDGYYNLALCHAKLGQASEAIDAARQALGLARFQGQTALAREIENWLNSYRASLSN